MKIKPVKIKKRNRRFGEPLGSRAKRFLKRAGKIALIVVPLPVIGYGAWWAYNQALTTPYLAISSIGVSGTEKVAKDEVLNLAGISQGQNLFAFSSDDVVARLKGNPWIELAEVTRHLPDEVEINIKERKPIVLVKLDNLYVMDANGVIFKKYSSEDALDLPVVTGLSMETLAKDEKGVEGNLLELISVLTKRSGFNITNISEISVDPNHGLSVYTLDEGVRLDFGMGGFEDKLASFEKIMETRGGVLNGIEAFDLNNHREVVVRFITDVVKEGGDANGKKG